MSRALNAQTFGSLVVIGAFAAAEGAAAYLAACPGSSLAWYLNLAVFRPFEAARVETSPLHALFGIDALRNAAALAAITLAVRVLRFRFGVAAIANLCFVFAAALTYAWLGLGGPLRTVSLLPVSLPPMAAIQGPDFAVLAVMLASSFLAFAISHLSFAGRIRSERRRDPAGAGTP
ncbi:hypothetical protein [Methylobacterium sp. J-090]|uniref:hypothetical protein n=1 Tax=Methylobacterium sp. J-090 TaxID=2836666 RepID=UPI001FB97F47|nr:hypothetical protein [Methylobacterium sp. J-090]MCJ2082593.1 hypothetical protein [Methylobacterium sp. J-090]